MTESNPPVPQTSTPSALPPGTAPVPPTRRPRRKLRLVMITLGVLLLLLVALVLLLPTLASTSPVRSLLVSKAQAFVPHGKLEVGGYSLGWFSPLRATGVKLYDDRGRVVLEADELKTDLTLLQAARQHFDLSGTVVDAGAHVVVYANGSTNLQHVLGLDEPKTTPATKASTPEPKKQEHAAKPTRLPNVNGDITLKLQGDVTLVDAAETPVAIVRLRPGSGGTIKIPNINAPVDADLKFDYDTGEGTPAGSVGVQATFDAVDNNTVVDVSQIGAKLNLPVQHVDFAGLKPLLVLAKQPDLRLAGVADGTLSGELKPGEAGAIKGEFSVANLSVAGPPLLDTYQAAAVQLPVEINRIVSGTTSRLQLNTRIVLPQASLTVTGDVAESSITHLKSRELPGDTGAVNVSITADLKQLAAALPKTLRIPAGVTVSDGTFNTDVTAALRPADVQAHVKTVVVAHGTRDGKPIAIDPITFTSDATLTDLEHPVPGLRDLAASFSSAFATFQASGPSVARVQGKGNADLAKARDQLAQFNETFANTQMAGTATFALTSRKLSADPAGLHAELSADVADLHVKTAERPPLDLKTAKLSAISDLRMNDSGLVPTVLRNGTATLVATADQPLVDVAATFDDVDLARTTAAKVSISKLSVPSLPSLQTVLAPFVPAVQSVQVTNGGFYFGADLKGLNWTTYAVELTHAEGSLPNLRLSQSGKEILRDTVRFSAAATLKADAGVTAIDVSQLSLTSGLAKVTAKNIAAKKADSVPAFKMVESADLDATVDNLARVQAVLSAFKPDLMLPVSADGAVALQCAIHGGTAKVDFTGRSLAVHNSKGQSYAFDSAKPVTLSLNADITGDKAVDAVHVSALSGDFGVAKVSLAGPLDVKNVATSPTVAGKVRLTGVLEQIAPLLQVVQQADTPLPYRGTFDLTEAVTPDKGLLGLKGGGTIADFALLDTEGKPQFTEPQVRLDDDLTVDLAKQSATVTSLVLDLVSSGAAKVSVNGGLEDWGVQRRLKNMVVKVNADGQKVWPLVYGLMPPNQQTQFKDAKLSGPVVFDLTANGSYPAKPTWNESVRSVLAYGSVSMKSLQTMGLTLSDFALPITISDNGRLFTGDLRKKKGERFAKPFGVNEGQGDFGSISLFLGDPDLKLSIGRNQQLLKGVQINPVLASQVGSLASVLFNDSENASGSLDLTVAECNNVLLKDLMDKKATASFVYSIKQLRLDGKVPAALSQVLRWGDSGITGDIDGATLTLKNGIANQDMLLTLEHETTAKSETKDQADKDADTSKDKTRTESMKFQGGVKLADNTFKDYHLTLSPGLLIKDMRKKFPTGATVELKGKVTDMKSILAQAVAQLAVQGYGEDALGKVLGKDKGDGQGDSLDKLLGKLGKKKSK